MRKALPKDLAIYEIPAAHRRRLRSTKLHEWMNKKVKRRTRVATLFPNEASGLRLVGAVCSEISEDWEPGGSTSPWRLTANSLIRVYRRELTQPETTR